jgi:hypothetical protein
MAGANVTMVCSALLRYGIAHLTTLKQQLAVWMESHDYESVNQLQGCMSQLNCSDPAAFERAQYIRAIARLPARALSSYGKEGTKQETQTQCARSGNS